MKKLRKVFSLLLVLSLVLSCGMASAVNMAEQDYEVVYADENITITAYTYDIAAQPRIATNDDPNYKTADPYAHVVSTCSPAHGNKCTLVIENIDTSASMDYTINYYITGGIDPTRIESQLTPGQGRYYTYQKKDGTALSGTVATDVEAVNAASVDFYYSFTQFAG